MTSIEDIWNAPLFLNGSDNEDDQMPDAPPRRATPQPEVDVNAIFARVDNLPDGPGDDTRPPALTPHQILSSSPAHHLDDTGDKGDGKNEKDAKKPKKKAMRLDEGRLIECFPQLVEDTKNIKVKGKGHEARVSQTGNCPNLNPLQISDLNRLLQVYQFWTHRLYPKTPFKDTVDRVEKLCHSKQSAQPVERRSAGIAKTGEDEEDSSLIDLTDTSNPAPDSDQADYASSSSHEATRPPSSVDGDARASSVEGDHDFSFDAGMQAAMDATAKLNSRQPASSIRAQDMDDEDIEAEAAAAEMEAAKAARPQVPRDEDDDFWDIVDTVAMDTATKQTISAMPVSQHKPTDDEDEDWAALDSAPAVSAPQHTRADDADEWDALDAMAVDGS
ncbi:replication fork protection component Swi3-domain-containing protein [Mycena galopus ATCC 62051]|nr:replication fork protection component Swi3-domain-containing protein [Mycena galopus ATCC 62051]